MSEITDKNLADLHAEIAKQLKTKIKSGEFSASMLKEAREFLKDNGINGTPKKGTPLEGLETALTEEELTQYRN